MSRDNVYINDDKRTILLQDDVDNETIGKIINSIILWNKTDDEEQKNKINYIRQRIHFYINSDGGSTEDMFSLVDVMLGSKTIIYTYCTGYACSSALKIFLAGHRRFASKHSIFLYHQMHIGLRGKVEDSNSAMKMLNIRQSQVEEYVASRTKITRNKLNKIRENKTDWYFYLEEAIELGVVTNIIE